MTKLFLVSITVQVWKLIEICVAFRNRLPQLIITMIGLNLNQFRICNATASTLQNFNEVT